MPLNQTELFFITAGLSYAQIILSVNHGTLTDAQKAALQNFITAG